MYLNMTFIGLVCYYQLISQSLSTSAIEDHVSVSINMVEIETGLRYPLLIGHVLVLSGLL